MSEGASTSNENSIYITAYKLRGFQYARGTPKKETPCKSCCASSSRTGLAWERLPPLLQALNYGASKLLIGADDDQLQPIVDALTKLRDHHEAMEKLSDEQLKHGEDAYAPAVAIAQRYQQACKQYNQCITNKLGFDLDSAIAELDKIFEMGSKQTLNQSVERCWHQIIFRKPLVNADPFAADMKESTFYHYCQVLNQLKAKSSDSTSTTDHLMYMVVALFGLVEGGPFSEYNDSLAAVLMMRMWKEFNLPLRVSDAFLRDKDFMEAMDATRSYVSLGPRGTATAEHVERIWKSNAPFLPLVMWLKGFLTKELQFFHETLKAAPLPQDHLESVAKTVREQQAKEDECMMCYETSCNIATLCCGRATHLNCLAKWLQMQPGNSHSCPTCRFELPKLELPSKRRQSRAVVSSDEEGDSSSYSSEEDSSYSDGEDEEDSFNSSNSSSNNSDDDSYRRYDYDSYFERQWSEARRYHESSSDDSSSSTSSSSDDDENETANNNSSDEDESELAHQQRLMALYEEQMDPEIIFGLDGDEDEDEELGPEDQFLRFSQMAAAGELLEDIVDEDAFLPRATTPIAAATLPPVCCTDSCRNQSATGCPNLQCGRCCRADGIQYCARHEG